MFDIYLLDHEVEPSELSALEYVISSAQTEIERIDNMIERILEDHGPESELLQPLYERLDEMDPSTFETRAATILTGIVL
jgi:ATP-binding cassette subfamily F protein 2